MWGQIPVEATWEAEKAMARGGRAAVAKIAAFWHISADALMAAVIA